MEIFTTGYPRSGSTWLNRLLGDLFNSPLQATPAETRQWYGLNKGIQYNNHVIRKTHWMAQEYSGNHYPDTEYGPVEKIVFLQRDPRDVAISAMYYSNSPSLTHTIKTLAEKRPHLQHKVYHIQGWYENWLRGWLDSGKADVETRYEKLSDIDELARIVRILTGDVFSREWLEAVASRQQFANHAPNFSHSMRKGIVGDWKNHFTQKDGEYITEHLGQFMVEQGYIEDLEWWKNLKN